jgi:hypothetical protein
MKRDQQWTVRTERQPHRDAVRRLRKAYGQLYWMNRSTLVATKSEQKAEKAAQLVQEEQV